MFRILFFVLLFSFINIVSAQTAEEFYIKGIQKMDEHKYTEAIVEFTNAINKNNKFSEAYLKKGTCLEILGDNEKALADFDKVIDLNPDNSIAHYNRGLINKEMNNYEEAINDFSSAIALNTSLKYAFFNRALCKLRLDDYENACDDLSKAADLGVENAAEIYKYTCKKP